MNRLIHYDVITSVSVTHYKSITKAPDIKRLEGKYYQIGASAAVPIEGIPFAGAGDIMLIPDERLNTTYYGITQNMGVGSPGVESHVEWGTTGTVPHTEFNIFDVAQSIYSDIMRW